MKEIEFQLMLGGEIVGYEKPVMDDVAGNSYTKCFIETEKTDWILSKVIFFGDDPGDRYAESESEYYYIRHDAKKQYTGYEDFDGNKIYDGNIVEIENGSFIGLDYGDRSLHYITWCPDYGSWVMIGLDVFCEDGTPAKNSLNNRWTDKQFLTATCHPLRVVGYTS